MLRNLGLEMSLRAQNLALRNLGLGMGSKPVKLGLRNLGSGKLGLKNLGLRADPMAPAKPGLRNLV